MGKVAGVDTNSCGKPGVEVGTGFHLDGPEKVAEVVGNDPELGGKPGDAVVAGFQLDVDFVRDGVDAV